MDNTLLEQSLTDAFELWRLAANNITHLEHHPDQARIELCQDLLNRFLDVMTTIRKELQDGQSEGRSMAEQIGLLCILAGYANDLALRFSKAAEKSLSANAFLVFGAIAKC